MRSIAMREELVGREVELARVGAFVAGEGPAAVCAIAGEAGIGKTAVWRAALDAAAAAGVEVRATRAREAEAAFSFSVVSDLLADLPAAVLASLPGPQRRALEIALLVREGEGAPPEPRAVAAAILSTLRTLAADRRLLVAVDDLQWADAASAAALEYAVRRSAGSRVRFLFTIRTAAGDSAAFLADEQVERATLGPLSLGALQRLLSARLERSPGRQVVRRIHETSAGNPFFAIELTRALERAGGGHRLGRDLVVPPTLTSLLGEELDRLDPAAERAVMATALLAAPRASLVAAALDEAAALESAVAAGMLEVSGDAVRLAHPLFGSVARERAGPRAVREMHARLAGLVGTAEERARHRALGTLPPDEAVAAELGRVAEEAAGRGAVVPAAELAEQAWRFTPLASPERPGRLLAAAVFHRRSGAHRYAATLLEEALPSLAPVPDRVRALFTLAQLQSPEARLSRLGAALAEAEGALRAEILAEMASSAATGSVGDLPTAHEWAKDALALARACGDRELMAPCVIALAFVESMLGRDASGLLDEITPEGARLQPLFDHPDRVRAVAWMWRGDLRRARGLFEQLQALAHDREEEFSQAIFALHLFELALRRGDGNELAAAAERLLLLIEPFDEGPGIGHRARAALAALRGHAETAAEEAAAAAGSPGDSREWHTLEARRCVGLAALLAGDAARAAEALGGAERRAAEAGVGDPGVFPLDADLAEALVALGRLDDAEERVSRLERAAAEQGHAWAAATGARARGLLLAARGDNAGAEGKLLEALDRHRDLDLPLDEGRARLALGTLYRRLRRRREARELLEAAAARFEALAVPPLAARAREELARISGRRTASGLTATEQRVAELVAEGLTNKQVAERLVVSVAAVEAHLTRIYAKLGLRRRTELALKVWGSPD